ncbi:hypothetical protein FT641_19320 [Bacillus paranthracis]|uniref:hypothetical protein n=1 Tax=Bacillus paranthracis TaxID=2026186 RepID=UPI00187AA4C5|nr:hypothetical protein [Bacillus paranthracis]MBE7114284.1 hypothetical protein [Bacillus paranthracis]MBE7154843.1 hypothetical protein [Bacillus paranthracis]
MDTGKETGTVKKPFAWKIDIFLVLVLLGVVLSRDLVYRLGAVNSGDVVVQQLALMVAYPMSIWELAALVGCLLVLWAGRYRKRYSAVMGNDKASKWLKGETVLYKVFLLVVLNVSTVILLLALWTSWRLIQYKVSGYVDSSVVPGDVKTVETWCFLLGMFVANIVGLTLLHRLGKDNVEMG